MKAHHHGSCWKILNIRVHYTVEQYYDVMMVIVNVVYLEEPVISLAPVIPWVRQRSVDRDLVTDILVERIVLEL